MTEIARIAAREVLDSRGNPTVEVDVLLADGAIGRAAVPSGASTGAHEAVELRDGDKARYGGKGVLKAVEAVRTEIADAIRGMVATEQVAIDKTLDRTRRYPEQGPARCQRDPRCVAGRGEGRGAVHRPAALPLCRRRLRPHPAGADDEHHQWRQARGQPDRHPGIHDHAGLRPAPAPTPSGSARNASRALKKQLHDAHHNTNVGDEGGFAPNIGSADEALGFIAKACEAAGHRVGEDIMFALDCASTEFFKDGKYVMEGEGKTLDAGGMVDYLAALCAKWPIISIEDGCAEDDWAGWKLLTEKLGQKVQLVGDDLFVTNPERLRQGIETGTGNAILVKVNQIGTLTETLEAVEMAHRAGYKAVMSHRSGETEDATIADLAVATNCGQIKTGSLSPLRPPGQVQPAHPHRGGAGCRGALRRQERPPQPLAARRS